MAGKIVIEIYKDKNVDELTKIIADPESKLDTGSGAALNFAVAASLLSRAAALTAKSGVSGEKIDYIVKNAEKLREYMVFLIDDDVRSKNPLRQAIKNGSVPEELEAVRRPTVAISVELVNMTGQGLEMALDLAEICSEDAKPYIEQFAHTVMAVAKCSVSFILSVTQKSNEETYRYVSKRENEITMDGYQKLYDRLMEKLG